MSAFAISRFPASLSAIMPVILLCAAVFLLAGCKTFEESRGLIDQEASRADAARETARAPVERYRVADTVRYDDGIWLGSRSFKQRNGDPLPGGMEDVTFVSARPLSLRQLAAEIGNLTGIPVIVEDDLVGGVAGATGPGSAGAIETSAGAALGSLTGEAGTGTTDRVRISWSGPLRGLVDQVAQSFDATWEFRNGEIRFYRVVTQVFALFALPSTTTLNTEITNETEGGGDGGGGGGGGGGGSGGAGTSSELSAAIEGTSELTVEIWREVVDAVNRMVPANSRVSLSVSTGTLTVTAPHWAMRRVETFLEEMNQRLTRQVAINVTVLNVTLEEDDTYGFDLDQLVFDGTDISINVESDSSVIGLTPAPTEFTVGILDGRFSGSNAFIRALSSRGDVAIETSSSITTLNNQPVPVQVVESQGFIRERSVTVNENSTSEEIEAGTVTTGFVLSLLPRILADGRVMLQYSLSLSDLLALQDIGGANGIQVPTVSTRAFLQQSMLYSGDTLVLAGFEEKDRRRTERGTGAPWNFLFGGEKLASNERELIVIMITPRVLQPMEPRNRPFIATAGDALPVN